MNIMIITRPTYLDRMVSFHELAMLKSMDFNQRLSELFLNEKPQLNSECGVGITWRVYTYGHTMRSCTYYYPPTNTLLKSYIPLQSSPFPLSLWYPSTQSSLFLIHKIPSHPIPPGLKIKTKTSLTKKCQQHPKR